MFGLGNIPSNFDFKKEYTTFGFIKNFFQMKHIFILATFLSCACLSAQDNLIKSLEANQSESSTDGFHFTPIINLDVTSVKDQGSSGTCWSYTGSSFLEAEVLRKGGKPIDLAEIYTARNSYIEKAKNYVRMHGNLSYGDGGELHDVINMYRKYGALPQQVYSGLNYGTTRNQFNEMQEILSGFLKSVVKNTNKKLTPNWLKAFTAVLDTYLGEVPETFFYEGKIYTPKSFAEEVVKLDPDDYIEMVSYNDEPKYKMVFMAVPDNWSFDYAYNVDMEDFIRVIDYALKKGYTVGWAADVSERYFSWKNGVAFVPEKSWEDMSVQEKQDLFKKPQPELTITPQMRQEAFDNYQTTDDHAMHIVGLAKDQNGTEYYIVKNSWGESNDYKGYLYVTKNFVRYKTTAILVNKNGVPANILKK